MNLARTGQGCLDTILYGGLPRGSSIVVEGAPGTGKTTLAIQFLYYGAVRENEPGIYVTFEELPDQIYQDMGQFGWDLKEMERRNLLRIVCISPKLFIEQIMKAGGIIEKVIHELQCKRIVIDTISLLRLECDSLASYRRLFYSLRNALRKFQITALLLQERSFTAQEELPLENYVSDGVIRLSLKQHLENYRKRTIEVLKMRGSPVMEGEHHYKFTDSGIHVVSSLSLVFDKVQDSGESVSTGIQKMDQLLLGGFPTGSSFLVDTNSKANYKYFITSIIAEHLKAGFGVISFGSSLTTLQDTMQLFEEFGIDLADAMKRNRFNLIEHYGRAYPEEFSKAIIDVSNTNAESYKRVLSERLNPIMVPSMERGDKWFGYYDLNTLFSQQGIDFVTRFYSEEMSKARAYGLTVLSLCNFAEIRSDVASYLERASSGVIRTWVDGSYQYLQLTKSPHAVISEPLIAVATPEAPFIQLL